MDIGKPQRIIMVEPLDVEIPVEATREAAPIRREPKQAAPVAQPKQHPVR